MEGIIFQRTVSGQIEYFIRQLSEDQRISLTYRYEDIVKNCAFNTETCTLSDFSSIYNIVMGNCYTYNNERRTVKKVFRGGPSYGLKLFVYSNLSDYLGVETSNDTFGYFIPPSTAASLTIRAACRRSCFQHRAQKECGCVHPAYRRMDRMGMVYCTFNDTVARDCLNRLDGTDFQCDCPNRCTERTFDVDISTSSWRSESGRSLCHKQSDCDELLRNGMLITVYFEDLNERILAETPAYPLINLMSDTAGQFGFWIGLSFLGVIEFLLFIISISRVALTELIRFYRQIRAPRLPPPEIFPEYDAPPIFFFGDPILPRKQVRWINSVPSHVEERLRRHRLSTKSLEDLSKL
ncbi:hypothetical protein PFISCL1PPCAC_9902 [Pristionchus fissidentatus]|uniref:Ion channel n=1 Tax=Pristionchus fissidentatus TaxID=1538716 RepID=A0AAV5VFZ6_9BILA|nr:hypothetical protein PFISCL1PPCAC_9902 [Pristionchus fissidentatus]